MIVSTAISEVLAVYRGSDGDATKALYQRLEQLGPIGAVAVDLFRAQKNSERAKVYRGGGYRSMAYDRKDWAIGNLAATLEIHAEKLEVRWGWGIDQEQPYHRDVLYVDLPTGQVSFHCAGRKLGPDYPGEWDGVPGRSADRIVRWVARVLDGNAADAPPAEPVPTPDQPVRLPGGRERRRGRRFVSPSTPAEPPQRRLLP